MTVDHRELYFPRAPESAELGVLARFRRELAPQDWFVFGYLLLLNVAAWTAVPGPERTLSMSRTGALLLFQVATLIAVRGGLLRHGFWAPLMYRFAIYGTVQLSYFFLADLLPLVNTTTLDIPLYKLDLALFGFEPALVFDQIVNPLTTEWFAFFYFSYFFLLAVHVIPIMMFARSQRMLSVFALGMLTVFCMGHLIYMLVPGFGPYKAMADAFQNPLPSGMWMDMVNSTVASGGAQMDIFPSLHTAGPTFIALFSYRYRDRIPFRYTWPFVVFFALNIIIATMFLRWHYIIDVVAGLCLATTALFVGVSLTENTRRDGCSTDSWPRFSANR